ncbi:yqeH, partial [Symbiodinium necroappetens]
MVFCRSHLSIQMAAVAAQRLSIPRLAGESCRGGFFRTCWPGNHGSVGMVSATRSASSSRAWPSPSEEKSQDVEVKVPAGAVVGDVTKEAGMEELLRASRGGGGGLRIHKRCHGCGAWLHSNDPEEHGYVPEEAREKFSLTGRRKVRATPKGVPVDVLPQGVEVMRDTSVKYKDRTRMLVCQRCYRLQHYHRMDTPVKGGFYRMEGGRDWEHEAEIVEKIVRRMRWLVDALSPVLVQDTSAGRAVDTFAHDPVGFFVNLGHRKAWPLPANWQPKLSHELAPMRLSVPQVQNASSAPLPGVTIREPKNIWLYCAAQWEECACDGKIRWGNAGSWQVVPWSVVTKSNRVKCQVGKEPGFPALNDVRPGDDQKHCECQVNTASQMFTYINLLSLPKSDRKYIDVEPVASCGSFEQDTSAAGQLLWEGIRGVCDQQWSPPREPGSHALSGKEMTQAMRALASTAFAQNYQRLYREGWLQRGFVSYFKGPPNSQQAQLMELLIDSVHQFSVYPIVVLHVGLAIPMHWTPRVFPRLVVLSVKELPSSVKACSAVLQAALLSRVETGIFLSHDSLILPGIDRLYGTIASEVTEDHPWPIMPVHFLDKTMDDNEPFWAHFCANQSCPRQSMRWSQLSLSWSRFSLPFIGSTLRAVFRDETFSGEAPYQPLRLRKAAGAEELLNVALWEAGAYKQWCKFDLPDISEVEEWLQLPASTARCETSVCAPLLGDRRFYPDGVPKVFAYLRFTTDLFRARRLKENIARKKAEHLLPYPILAGKAYKNAAELRRDWPNLRCLTGDQKPRTDKEDSEVLMVVDLLDFESSLVPELFDACRNRRFPVIVVVNKVDCLLDKMRDKEKGLARLKVWVRRMSRQIRNVHTNDVVLISSSSGHGFKQLEERLRHHLLPEDPKWMYVVGRVNSGKSTFVNRFLWYIGYKHQGAVHYKRAVGGVTRSPVPGTTLHFVSFGLPKGFRLVDCPGIPSRHQVTAHLQEAMDLYAVVPRKRVNSISYALHTGRSFLAGALVRIDQVQGNISFLSSFFGLSVTLHVCQTCKVEDLLSRKAGDFFYPPHSRDDFERLGPLVRHRVEVFGSSDRAWDDIVIAGMGWVSISGYGTKVLDVWVPK